MEEYREAIRSQLEESMQASVDAELTDSVQTALMEIVEVNAYPEDRVEELMKQMTDYYTQLAG